MADQKEVEVNPQNATIESPGSVIPTLADLTYIEKSSTPVRKG